MATSTTVTDLPPTDCPQCERASTRWHVYTMFEKERGFMAGCGRCGYVARLTARPALPEFHVADGKMISDTWGAL